MEIIEREARTIFKKTCRDKIYQKQTQEQVLRETKTSLQIFDLLIKIELLIRAHLWMLGTCALIQHKIMCRGKVVEATTKFPHMIEFYCDNVRGSPTAFFNCLSTVFHDKCPSKGHRQSSLVPTIKTTAPKTT